MARPKKINKVPLFKTRYSKQLQDFIVDKIEDGMNVHDICQEYGPPKGELVPDEKTIYRWKKKYPEFKLAVHEAYETLMFKWTEEMDTLSKMIRDLVKNQESLHEDDPRGFVAKIKAEIDVAKVRLKALEFMITRIGKVFIPEFKEDAKGARQSDLPTVIIKQYIQTQEPVINDVENSQTKTIQ